MRVLSVWEQNSSLWSAVAERSGNTAGRCSKAVAATLCHPLPISSIASPVVALLALRRVGWPGRLARLIFGVARSLFTFD
jgi:hypothetical protein